MERRSFLLALGGVGLAATGALAKPMVMKDFRTADLAGGEFAMRSSQIALTKMTNPDITNFANAEIAEQLSVAKALSAAPGTVPLRRDHADLLAKLQAMPAGPQFNSAYVKGQLAGHRELLTLNSSYLKSGTDPALQSVANMSLPIIQQHLAVLNGLRNMA